MAGISRTFAFFNTHDIGTKIIRNFTSDIFGYYTFLSERYYFRVIGVNVKFGAVNQDVRHFVCVTSLFF